MRENRARLREAGFSSKDIDRLKNASPATIDRMLETKQAPEIGAKRPEPTRPERETKPRPVEVREPARISEPVPGPTATVGQGAGKTFRYGGKAESREERNKRLRDTERILREAGISKEDARRLRNASPDTLSKILETGRAPEKRHFYLREKKEFAFSRLPWVETPRQYTSRYNVVLELKFARKSVAGVETRTEHVTIQANFELSREDVMEAVNDIVSRAAEEQKEGSEWELVGVRIKGCFLNPDIAERPRPKNWQKYKD